ncbi:olfactory receptor 6F1-like [Pleurodeles waltl]|uniref:olfactory receptor 6F1-like n=1 Tax=Pleurodeles waltl TaxID=8319 RepID=UPI003709A7D7
MEPLAAQARAATWYQGLQQGARCHTISLYADDLLLFLQTTGLEMEGARNLLALFGRLTGLRVSCQKSFLSLLSVSCDPPGEMWNAKLKGVALYMKPKHQAQLRVCSSKDIAGLPERSLRKRRLLGVALSRTGGGAAVQKLIMVPTMCAENITSGNEFLLLGLHVIPELKPLLFLLFVTIYVLTVIGNSLIVVTVSVSERLHSPMFFFLGNFSFLEVCYSTSTAPIMLSGLMADSSSISFAGCLMQFYFFISLLSSECFLLTVMAYDRYTAICFPLHYSTLMDRAICVKLLAGAWVGGFTPPFVTVILLQRLRFSGEKVIDHFFCDFAPLLKTVCSETSYIEVYVFIMSFLVLSIPFLLIILSYVYIMSAILRIPSATGKHKAFSTCSSHLAVVSTYFGPLIAIYSTPKTESSINVRKALSLLYSVATPLLNPIIYTLRNKEIRETWMKALHTIP